MKKILVVCLGNICRSPLAEGILRDKLDSKNFKIDSAGTAKYHTGKAPDIRSIEVAKKNNIDISKLKVRQFTSKDFEEFDYIFAMDNSNYQNIISLTNNEKERSKISLFMDVLYPNENIEVPDPYYGGREGFDNVFSMLEEASIKLKVIL